MPHPTSVHWIANPKQKIFLNASEFEVLYGGAAGGGKSDALLMFSIMRRMNIPKSKGLVLRRTYPELERSLILRSMELLSGRAKYSEQKHRWVFPNKSILEFGYCEQDDDVYKYQSAEYEDVCFDELTQFTEFQYTYLMSRCRTTKPDVLELIRGGTNPGGVGHGWVKERFIDVAPWGEVYTYEVEDDEGNKTQKTRRFIPARLKDNLHIKKSYAATLSLLPEDQKRALRDGDWDVYEGQYFPEFARLKDGKPWHVVEPSAVTLEPGWRRFRSIDWGFKAPCCVLWHCVDPDGRIYTYRELYVTQKMASEVAKMMLEMSEGETIDYTAASPDMWAKRGNDAIQGESIAETFANSGVYLTKADNSRVNGWTRMREYLGVAPDGLPWWQIFSTCRNLIRTLPALVYDKHRVEDVSDKCEDHAPEAARYGLMSRPRPFAVEKKRKKGHPIFDMPEPEEVFLQW